MSTRPFYELFKDELNHFLELKEAVGQKEAKRLDALLNFPSKAFKTIHIAGTNGKGSLAWKIARGLAKSRVRVGLTHSPHLVYPSERIWSFEGVIPPKRLLELLNDLKIFCQKEGIPLHFFLLFTFAAFLFFKETKMEVVVVETGIGGKNDPTVIIDPILTAITSIGFDHQEILGQTLDLIAGEKAGIIKPCVPLILGPKARFPAIFQAAKEKMAPITFLPDSFEGYNVATGLAKLALSLLEKELSIEDKKFSIEDEELPARFEVVGDIVLDVAHNIDGFLLLFSRLAKEFPGRPLFVWLGISKEKNLKAMVEVALANALAVFLAPQSHPRLFSFEDYPTHPRLKVATFEEALCESRKSLALMVVVGSFHVLRELVPQISKRFEDHWGKNLADFEQAPERSPLKLCREFQALEEGAQGGL